MNHLLHKLDTNKHLPKDGHALDLGCGRGADTETLISLGYSTTSVDKDTANIHAIKEKGLANNTVVEETLEEYAIKENHFSLIVANNVLPFIAQKEDVKKIVQKIHNGLTSDGYACVTFFGTEDDWTNKEGMSFWDYEEIKDFLTTLFARPYFESTEIGFGPTMSGTLKRWHIHRFILTKHPQS